MTTILLFKNNASLVDQLGRLQAQIADLEAKEKALKAALVAAGVGAYESFSRTAAMSSVERSEAETVARKSSPS
jgi:hypothetical protein